MCSVLCVLTLLSSFSCLFCTLLNEVKPKSATKTRLINQFLLSMYLKAGGMLPQKWLGRKHIAYHAGARGFGPWEHQSKEYSTDQLLHL